MAFPTHGWRRGLNSCAPMGLPERSGKQYSNYEIALTKLPEQVGDLSGSGLLANLLSMIDMLVQRGPLHFAEDAEMDVLPV